MLSISLSPASLLKMELYSGLYYSKKKSSLLQYLWKRFYCILAIPDQHTVQKKVLDAT